MTAQTDTIVTLTAEPVQRLTINTETIFRGVLCLMISVGSISFIEPSPYEIVFFILVPMAVFGHFIITRVTMALFFVVSMYLTAEILALMPHIVDRPLFSLDGTTSSTSTIYTLETIYLYVSALIFTMIFTRHTVPRLRLALIAYTISTIFAASWAIAAYLDVPGFSNNSGMIVTRISGPFKDPNVLGSYCVLGVLYLMQSIVLGWSRWRPVHIVLLAVTIFGGIVLPLSRGAVGALVFAVIYLGVVTFWTADTRRMRRTLIVSAAGLFTLIGLAGAVIESDASLRETVSDRAKLEQDYDGGFTGRFGNQKRSIPMLMERPLGFGPHRFAMHFDLDPHNSYIGAFSSAGWMGGAAFILMVLSTSFLAIRLSIIKTPFMRHAQVITPTLLSAFLQAFQIDVDHWRFIYLMIGAIWGMEASRHLARCPQSAPTIRPASNNMTGAHLLAG